VPQRRRDRGHAGVELRTSRVALKRTAKEAADPVRTVAEAEQSQIGVETAPCFSSPTAAKRASRGAPPQPLRVLWHTQEDRY
jgi:hypothetical protein